MPLSVYPAPGACSDSDHTALVAVLFREHYPDRPPEAAERNADVQREVGAT